MESNQVMCEGKEGWYNMESNENMMCEGKEGWYEDTYNLNFFDEFNPNSIHHHGGGKLLLSKKKRFSNCAIVR